MTRNLKDSIAHENWNADQADDGHLGFFHDRLEFFSLIKKYQTQQNEFYPSFGEYY